MRTLNNIVQKWASPKATKDNAAARFFYPEWFEFCDDGRAAPADGGIAPDTSDDEPESVFDPLVASLATCDEMIFDFGSADGAPGWFG